MPDGRVNNGGARPGAGAKKQETIERQQAIRDLVLDLAEAPYNPNPSYEGVTYAKALWITTFHSAINGDVLAANSIISYIAGAKPREPLVTVDNSQHDNRTAIVWGIAWQPPELPDSNTKAIEGTAHEVSP